MSSTYSPRSSVFSRNIPPGKCFSWLFPKFLPTNNHNQCQLYDNRKIKECVLIGCLPDKENKNNNNNNDNDNDNNNNNNNNNNNSNNDNNNNNNKQLYLTRVNT